MFIHRPDKNATEKELAEGKIKQNVAEILVEKHRNGEQGIVNLYFKGECTKFLNINRQTNEVEDDDEKENVKPKDLNIEGVEDLPARDESEFASSDGAVKSIDDELYGN